MTTVVLIAIGLFICLVVSFIFLVLNVISDSEVLFSACLMFLLLAFILSSWGTAIVSKQCEDKGGVLQRSQCFTKGPEIDIKKK